MLPLRCTAHPSARLTPRDRPVACTAASRPSACRAARSLPAIPSACRASVPHARSSWAPKQLGDAAAVTQQQRPVLCSASASASLPSAAGEQPADAPFELGLKVQPALVAIAIGLVIRFIVPTPTGLTPQAWNLAAIFATTVAGLMLQPVPVGAWAFLCITATVATKTLTFGQAFGALTTEAIWLVVVALFFAKAIEKTGVGKRIAQWAVKAFGGTPLGLAYGLNAAEAVVSPAMPSPAARASNIFAPEIKAISAASDSLPGQESRTRLGSFLVSSQMHTSTHASNLFLTASATNLLCMKLAEQLGVVPPNVFATWTIGALPPALVAIILTPLVLSKLSPPEVTTTPDAPAAAAKQLEQMGPIKLDEKLVLATVVATVALWMVGDRFGVSAVLAGLVGLCALLVAGVLTWKDCLTYTPAWDNLVLYTVIIGMSTQLNLLGVPRAVLSSGGGRILDFALGAGPLSSAVNAVTGLFSGAAGGALVGLYTGWQPVFFTLHAAFFALHYFFTCQVAHVAALYTVFCSLMLAGGCPPVLSAFSLAYSVNLFGSLTTHSSGHAKVYDNTRFATPQEVMRTGAIAGAFGLLVWRFVGMPWWRYLGWW